jgi:hypothetical protein
VHHAPEVDVDQLSPGVEILPRSARIVADAGIVHEERYLAEFFVGFVGEVREVGRLGYVAGDSEYLVGAAGSFCDRLSGGFERCARAVGEHDVHAPPGEALRCRQPDAAGAAGDDSRATVGEGGDVDRVGIHVRLLLSVAQSSRMNEYFHCQSGIPPRPRPFSLLLGSQVRVMTCRDGAAHRGPAHGREPEPRRSRGFCWNAWRMDRSARDGRRADVPAAMARCA